MAKESLEGDFKKSVVSGPFGEVKIWRRVNPFPAGTVGRIAETRTAFTGVEGAEWVYEDLSSDGSLLVWDSTYARTEWVDTEQRVLSAADQDGPVYEVRDRTPDGRVSLAMLGELYAVRYTYDDFGWVSKEVLLAFDMSVLWRVDRPTPLGGGLAYQPLAVTNSLPGHVTQFHLAGFGPLVEWDEDLAEGKNLIAYARNEPWKFVPTTPGQPMWRTASPFSDSEILDRIDYDEDQIRFVVETGEGGLASSAPFRAAVYLPRRQVGADPASGFRNPEAADNCTYVGRYYKDRTTGQYIYYLEVRCVGETPLTPNQLPGPGKLRFTRDLQLERQLARELGDAQANRTREALAMAIGKLLNPNLPSCPQLFSFPGSRYKDGTQALLGTRYKWGGVPNLFVGGLMCKPGLSALTNVGWSTVWLCRDFFTSSDPSARANILIHEALHTAGLLEARSGSPSPHPTSLQIQGMVDSACGY